MKTLKVSSCGDDIIIEALPEAAKAWLNKATKRALNLRENIAAMEKNEIIFFDELGFGWVVDKAVIKMIHASCNNQEKLVEKTLADLLRCA